MREPQFDFMVPEQEELAIKFCEEIAGKRGYRPSPPDLVRLLEMAEALYKAEVSASAPPPSASADVEAIRKRHENIRIHGIAGAYLNPQEANDGNFFDIAALLSHIAALEQDKSEAWLNYDKMCAYSVSIEQQLSEARERAEGMEKHAAAMREFIRWALQSGPWDGCDLDGGDVQAKAQKLGLVVSEPYDPEKHGEPGWAYDYADIKPGDDWFVFAPFLKESNLSTDQPEQVQPK